MVMVMKIDRYVIIWGEVDSIVLINDGVRA